MLKNFFITAYRNLSKNKLFTTLHVFGLALGMCLCLLYIAWLAFIFTYDDFHPMKDRIYRVTTQLHDNEENPLYASAPVGLAPKLQEEIAGVEKLVRVNSTFGGEAIYKDKKLFIDGYFADPSFFEIFNFPILRGSIATALSNPNTVVISLTEAEKIFGDKDPMGEMIRIEPYGDLLITGVFDDIPLNSHMQFGAIASYATLLSYQATLTSVEPPSWTKFANSYLYVLLSENVPPATIRQSLNIVASERYKEAGVKATFDLQPLKGIVPGPEIYDSIGPVWQYLSIFLIGAITLVVLIPACSNYINLSISQSLERMKEIGVRKVMGGEKKHIFLMFVMESTIVAFIALLLSFVLFEAIRKDFIFQLVETVPIDLTPTWITFAGFVLFTLLVGVTAGIVPAFYFLKIAPLDALKGKELKSSGRSVFRKIVLTLQFMLSIGFTMAVLIMIRQYQYSVNYDLGFEQQNVLDVTLQNIDPQVFKHEYGKLSSVHSVSLSSHLLGIGSATEQFIRIPNQLDSIEASSISIDETFITNMELDMLAGSGFTANASENMRQIIVNEEFVKRLNLASPIDAINRRFILSDGREVRIAGVLKNFHYSGLNTLIKNFFFEYNPATFTYANLKLQPGDLGATIAPMEKLWKQIGGEGDFSAQLFSDEIKDAYGFYVTIVKLWGFLGLLAITVACLGLLGSVSFSTKKRFKEISIRKVLGASSQNLVVLLSREFMMLMIIASLIAIPLVYFMFDYLLATIQHYNIDIGIIEISASLLLVLILGLTTILSQTLRAANSNPVNNLRNE